MDKKGKLNNHYYIIAGVVLILAIVLGIIACVRSSSKDAVKFKNEYEKLNGVEATGGQKYQSISIDEDNKVKYATLEEAESFLTEGTGLIYFGMPDCPWCRGIVPVLLEKIDCSCLENLLYVDMSDLRNTYEIQDDEPVETKKASSSYYNVLGLLDKYLENYKVEDADGIEHVLQVKRLYLPMVVAVKDGKIVGAHTGSVDLNSSQTAYDELTEVQRSELEVIFGNLIDSISTDDAVCDGHC